MNSVTGQVTLGELVKFVLENRRGKAFLGYPEIDIACNIKWSAEEGTMLYATDDQQKLCGIVVASKIDGSNVLFIRDILTTQKWVFKVFVKQLKEMFPGYTLRAQRYLGEDEKPKIVNYKTDRLIELVLKEKV